MAEETKELTFGQKAVGVRFNPSGMSEVDEVKQTFADIIDKIEQRPGQTYLANTFKGMAIRATITAQMAVVKFLTWQD